MTFALHTVSDCAHCGEAFEYIRVRAPRLYCGQHCQSAAKRQRMGLPPTQPRKPALKSICAHCRQTFTHKADRGTFCSRECSFEAKRAAPYTRVSSFNCRVCGTAVCVRSTQSTACSDDCRRAEARQKYRKRAEVTREPVSVRCGECGAEFTAQNGGNRRKYCSMDCSRRSQRRTRRKAERARLRSARVEPVNPNKVFERDGWRCQICGCQTPRLLRGSTKPRAPELDHRVPLSCGGDHSYANTQCACRECNNDKSNLSSVGQMPMFEAA